MLTKKKELYIRLLLILLILTVISYRVLAAEDLVTLKVRGADIKDVLIMLTEQSGINLVPDETVQGQVTINLQDIGLQEALNTLTVAYGYQFDRISDRVYLVSREGFSKPPEVEYRDGLLSLHVNNREIREVLNKISREAGINIIMGGTVSEMVSVDLINVPLELALQSFLQSNGFSLSKNNDIYRIFKSGGGQQNDLAISVVDGMVTIDVQQADVAEVLRTISRLSDLNMVLFSGVREIIDLKLEQIPVDEVIDTVLAGTRFTYRRIDNVYLIGDKSINSPASTLLTTNELIPLQYLQAEMVPQLLPNNFPAANVKVIKEQNALLVTGTQGEIDNLKKYIDKIDTKIPQIVVEALIVELSHNQSENPRLGLKYTDEETTLFDSVKGKLNYRSILSLPTNFYFELQSLVEKGLATVKARPNITTLNGQQASINVGTIRYYKVIKTDDDGNEQTTYQSVNAGVTLEVTPWVSSTGEISLKLRPTVSNIGGAVTEGPPEISQREANTTVRVKDGQTIIIGGLIQDVGSNSSSKVPVLGDIPIIGGLFQSEDNKIRQTEMVIYITPHVLKDQEETEIDRDMKRMLDKLEEVNPVK